MLTLFFGVFASLFSVVNPFGAVPVFLAMTPNQTPNERRHTALMTSVYFVGILLAFFFAGTTILNFFGIDLNAMRIAGGMVILSSGYALLSGKFEESRAVGEKVQDEARKKDDISFSPMAMPLLSGPGSISLLIGMYAEHTAWDSRGLIVAVVIATGLTVFLILKFSPYFYRVLGEAGIRAMTRIMGFLVMAIGVQYVIAGVVSLVKMLA
ncbi:MAG: MarC family NAAT transporter [Saprospiraceae bacterium]|jgi:multiple antibiotic resistance protein